MGCCGQEKGTDRTGANTGCCDIAGEETSRVSHSDAEYMAREVGSRLGDEGPDWHDGPDWRREGADQKRCSMLKVALAILMIIIFLGGYVLAVLR